MKFSSQIIAAGSGSVGGCTYSRNRYGQYIRRRAMPVNPCSAFAQAMTAFFATLVSRWTTTLTQLQRDSWDLWAVNTPQTDALGNAVTWTGQNAFISMNAFRLQAGKVIIDNAPAIFSGTSLSDPFVSVPFDESSQNFSLGFLNTDEWATEVGGILSIYVSRPQNPSVNYFKGPYRYAGTINGAVVPPTSPQIIPVPFPIVENQKVFAQCRAATADGRLSSLKRFSGLVQA